MFSLSCVVLFSLLAGHMAQYVIRVCRRSGWATGGCARRRRGSHVVGTVPQVSLSVMRHQCVCIEWIDNFSFSSDSAMVLESGTDEAGRHIPIKWYSYLLHFFSFFWKVMLAFVPPTWVQPRAVLSFVPRLKSLLESHTFVSRLTGQFGARIQRSLFRY